MTEGMWFMETGEGRGIGGPPGGRRGAGVSVHMYIQVKQGLKVVSRPINTQLGRGHSIYSG